MRQWVAKAFERGSPVMPGDVQALDERMPIAALATRGHVNLARAKHATDLLYWPMLVVGLVSLPLAVAVGMRASEPVPFPEAVRDFFWFDRATYYDLGGGLRGSPAEVWLASYRPTPESLSSAQHVALVEALADDIADHGAEPSQWARVAELERTPQITRPERVFSEHSGRLRDGVVAVPEELTREAPIALVAYVEAGWSVTLFDGNGRCYVTEGPAVDACASLPSSGRDDRARTLNRDAADILRTMRPQSDEGAE